MGEATSVIGLAVAFGLSFLTLLQYTTYLVKNSDTERKALVKELDTVKVINIDLQNEVNTFKLEINDLRNKYNRLAIAAKTIKMENDTFRNLSREEIPALSATEITNIEAEISIDLSIAQDIENATP